MDAALLTRLEKILALADSTHDGEAWLAMRKARAMLDTEGYSFKDLAGLALRRQRFLSFRAAPAPATPPLTASPDQQLQNRQLLDCQRRIAELEAQLAQSRTETRRWHRLAQESVDTLWQWAAPQAGGDRKSA